MHAGPNNRSFIYLGARGVDKVGIWRGKDNVAFKTILYNIRWLLSDIILKKSSKRSRRSCVETYTE